MSLLKLFKYSKLSHRERALLDGQLITYHFYVGGVTLLALGMCGTARSEPYAWVAMVFGVAGLAIGVALHLFHRYMIRGPNRDAYVATITAALGRGGFPVVPSFLGLLVVFSVAVTVLYILVE
ncbi:MAG: hypothetical protein ACYDA8_07855 [Deferrisomatales bacterium]